VKNELVKKILWTLFVAMARKSPWVGKGRKGQFPE
jgi:hypothetical protein